MNVKFKTNIVLRTVALGHLLKIEWKAITEMIKNDLIRDKINYIVTAGNTNGTSRAK